MHNHREQAVSSLASINTCRVAASQRYLTTIIHCSVISPSKSPRRSNRKREPRSLWTQVKQETLHFKSRIKSSPKVHQVFSLTTSQLTTIWAIKLSHYLCHTM